MKKMNMVEKFGAIKAMLNGERVENFTLADALAFLDTRIELTEKKNASGNGERKPTATQVANEGIKEQIMSVLSATDKALSIAEIQKTSADLGGLSNQKISSLLTQLVKADKLERTEVKGKPYYKAC